MPASASVKIVLIGAGSREFSAGLFSDIALERELHEARRVELWLVDIDEAALSSMHGYAGRVFAAAGVEVGLHMTTRREEALPGADFVLVSVEQKRMELWEQDFRLPIACGLKQAYGENGGPGALFHTLRNLEIVLPMAEDVERLCPGALLINFTNPEARMLKAILTLTKARAIGLCHGFYGFHRLAARVLGRPASSLDIRTAGMNHFFSCYKLADLATGVDLKGEFERRLAADDSVLEPLTRYFWRAFGVVGYPSDHHIGEYVGWAPEIMGLGWLFGVEGQALEPGQPPIDSNARFKAWHYKVDVGGLLRDRPGKRDEELLSGKAAVEASDIRPSGELAVPVITDIVLDRGRLRGAVNVLNEGGYIPNLDRDACVEVPATVDASGLHPDMAPPLPEAFAAQVRLQGSIQKLVTEAYRRRSRALLLQALLIDPAVDSPRGAERFLEEGFRLQAAYLRGWA
jgi:alpha-galactosidase